MSDRAGFTYTLATRRPHWEHSTVHPAGAVIWVADENLVLIGDGHTPVSHLQPLPKTPEIMNSLHGHPRGGGRGGVVTPGWVYDNEPWHWPPKERRVPMGITQEQYEQVQAIRAYVELHVFDATNELREDGEISIKDKEESKIVEAIVTGLFDLGIIDIAAVEARL